MELFRDNETNYLNETDCNMVTKKTQLVGGEPVGYFTGVAEDLNSGLPRTETDLNLGPSNYKSSTLTTLPPLHVGD